jgi:hypothetical protein
MDMCFFPGQFRGKLQRNCPAMQGALKAVAGGLSALPIVVPERACISGA